MHATAVSTVATQVREHTSGKAVLSRPEGLSTIVGADLQIARVGGLHASQLVHLGVGRRTAQPRAGCDEMSLTHTRRSQAAMCGRVRDSPGE